MLILLMSAEVRGGCFCDVPRGDERTIWLVGLMFVAYHLLWKPGNPLAGVSDCKRWPKVVESRGVA